MKTKTWFIVALIVAGFTGTFSTQAQTKSDLYGRWNAEASNAPPGYIASTMEVSENAVSITFSGENFSYTSTMMRFTNDSLVFEINGLDAVITLKVEDRTTMKGNAVWPEGESPIVLVKSENQEMTDPEEK